MDNYQMTKEEEKKKNKETTMQQKVMNVMPLVSPYISIITLM